MKNIITEATDCSHITPGKIYDIDDGKPIRFDKKEYHCHIIDDVGNDVLVVVNTEDCIFEGDTIIVPSAAIYSDLPLPLAS